MPHRLDQLLSGKIEAECGLPLEVGAGGDMPSTLPPMYTDTVSSAERKLMSGISLERIPLGKKNGCYFSDSYTIS